MLVYFILFINLFYLLFFILSYSFISIFVVFWYLLCCWLFFFLCLFCSYFSFEALIHMGYSFYISIHFDSLSLVFFFLSLLVFTSWFVFFFCYSYGLGFSYSNFASFFSLLHVSFLILFVGNVGIFIILLEFLSIPVFFLFTSVKSQDWFVGFSFLLLYSTVTGVFFVFSISYFVFCDWFWLCFMFDSYLFYFMFVSMLVKSSFFPFHSWLPYVHGLCSTSGSVFLAGIFLKLGSYGLVSVYFIIVSSSFFFYYQFLFLLFAFFGFLFSTFASIVQLDFKKFMAYSSVSHMNFTMLVLFIGGFYPSILVWFSHGFVTSLLFYSFGYVYYFVGSSLTLFFGNLVFMSLWFFLFIFLLVVDLGLPPFMSFYSELLSFSFMWSWSFFFSFLVCFPFIVSCYVSLNAIFSFSVGLVFSYVCDYTLPIFYLYSSFLLVYLFTSVFFVFDVFFSF